MGNAQAELEGMSRAATVEAEEFSGLVTETVAPVSVVSRSQWVEANIESFKFLMNPLAEKMSMGGEIPLPGQIGQVLRPVGAVFLGLQTGMVLGYLGRTVIGQYEVPLRAPQGARLLYVLSNLRRVEHDTARDPT